MAEHESAGQTKQKEVDRKYHTSTPNNSPLSQELMAWDISSYLMGDLAFNPPLQRHAVILSEAPSDEIRAMFTRQLQQTYGNRYVQRLVKSIELQTKLTVGVVDDPLELEADRVAEQVMSMPGAAGNQTNIQPQADEEEETSQANTPHQLPEISQKQVNSEGAVLVSPESEERVNRIQSGGTTLPSEERSFFEEKMGYDFSQVRIHTDSTSVQACQDLNAIAFTLGNNIAFNQGAYQPGTVEGRKLLAHELTHVVQQGGRGTPTISRWAAATHDDLTRKVIASYPDFNKNAIQAVAQFSGDMDTRANNYCFYGGSKIPIVGPVGKYLFDKFEAPQHGEANLYEFYDKTDTNIKKQEDYTKEAISLTKEEEGKGINDVTLTVLGNALHVAQDRGAHGEGLPGKGHDPERKKKDPNWKPDDRTINSGGEKGAITNSIQVLDSFVKNLSPSAKKALQTYRPSKTTAKGEELQMGGSTRGIKPLFYVGWSYYTIGTKAGRKRDVFGLWSPINKVGFGFISGRGKMVTLSAEVGERIMKLGHFSYVDATIGGFVGLGLSDFKPSMGLKGTISTHIIGRTEDYGYFLTAMLPFAPELKNISIIVGYSARF